MFVGKYPYGYGPTYELRIKPPHIKYESTFYGSGLIARIGIHNPSNPLADKRFGVIYFDNNGVLQNRGNYSNISEYNKAIHIPLPWSEP